MKTHDFFNVLSGYDWAVSEFASKCRLLCLALEKYEDGDDESKIMDAFHSFRDYIGYILERIRGYEDVMIEIIDSSEDGQLWFDQRNNHAKWHYDMVCEKFKEERDRLPERIRDLDLTVRFNDEPVGFPFFDRLIDEKRRGVKRPLRPVIIGED